MPNRRFQSRSKSKTYKSSLQILESMSKPFRDDISIAYPMGDWIVSENPDISNIPIYKNIEEQKFKKILDQIMEIENSSFKKEAFPRYLVREYIEQDDILNLISKEGREGKSRITGYIMTKVINTVSYIDEYIDYGVPLRKFLKKEEPLGHIISLAVHPDYRGKKIGKKLLETALSLLKRNGIFLAILEVETGNQNAIELYKKCGFKHPYLKGDPIKIEDYYEKGKDAYIMIADLQKLNI